LGMHSIKQEGQGTQNNFKGRGKRVASASTRQQTGQELKPLRKHVQFADFTGSMDFTGFKEPVETCKELRASKKRVGAIQVFYLRASQAESPSAGRY
jgi:hypothetical protein